MWFILNIKKCFLHKKLRQCLPWSLVYLKVATWWTRNPICKIGLRLSGSTAWSRSLLPFKTARFGMLICRLMILTVGLMRRADAALSTTITPELSSLTSGHLQRLQIFGLMKILPTAIQRVRKRYRRMETLMLATTALKSSVLDPTRLILKTIPTLRSATKTNRSSLLETIFSLTGRDST